MEKKLKRQFILTGLLAVAILLVMIDLGFRFLSYRQLNRSLEQTLTFIIEHNGTSGMIESEEEQTETEDDGAVDQAAIGTITVSTDEESERKSNEKNLLEKLVISFRDFSDSVAGNIQFTPETRYRVRYFLVTVDEDGSVSNASMSHIAAVDPETAESLALQHFHFNKEKGLLKYEDNSFYFKQVPKEDGTTVVGFLECTQEVRNLRDMRRITILISLLVVFLFTIILASLSGSAIRPYLENVESQKQFITNAGHELKTPLAIISANTEVIEMMDGKSEWTDSIKYQVRRSTDLINSMLALSRMNETQKVELAEVSLSELAEASAKSFEPVISQQKKKLETEISPDVKVMGDRNMLTELCNILIDNAAKYCDDGGTIKVSLKKKGRSGAALSVSNDYADGREEDYSKFFRRFYRGDTSHNSKKAGHGIGLSMASSIASKMNGKIGAAWKDGVITFTVHM